MIIVAMLRRAITKILVVDDEADITTILKIGLKKYGGFDVDVFNDPEEALRNIKPGIYDLMLLDLKMPKMDGVSLYRKAKEIDGNAKVCFITAIDSPDKELKQLASQSGIDCYLKKPISMNDLISKIQAVLLQ
jgi:two-component system catabolic regulation response regulator CreB/two-component system response regulator ChvI